MSDLIERLRKIEHSWCSEAADEIERNVNTIVRLAEELSRLMCENEELREELTDWKEKFWKERQALGALSSYLTKINRN